MSDLIRYRFNTMADKSPGGEWYWRVVLECDGKYKEVLAKQLLVEPPSFSKEDIMPVVGRKFHMACHGIFRLREDGVGVILCNEVRHWIHATGENVGSDTTHGV